MEGGEYLSFNKVQDACKQRVHLLNVAGGWGGHVTPSPDGATQPPSFSGDRAQGSVLVLRDVTEREEGVESDACRLVGTDDERIVATASELLSSPFEYAQMSRAVNPYGDGCAATRIVAALRGLPVDEWHPVELVPSIGDPV
jgi:hypothetical protein